MLHSLLAFLGAAIIVAMVPGPSTVMILRQSVRSGRRAGLATILGNETGILLWGLSAAFGLSVLLAVVWALVDMVWYGGIVWLVAKIKRAFERPVVRRRLEQISGVVLVALGIRLAAETRQR